MGVKRNIRKELWHNRPSKFIKRFIRFAKKYPWRIIKWTPGMTFNVWLKSCFRLSWHVYYKLTPGPLDDACKQCLCGSCKRKMCSNHQCAACSRVHHGRPTVICSHSNRVTNEEF